MKHNIQEWQEWTWRTKLTIWVPVITCKDNFIIVLYNQTTEESLGEENLGESTDVDSIKSGVWLLTKSE